MFTLPLLLAALAAIVGLVLIVVASRGRREFDRCACGYDLRATRRKTPHCPECGRSCERGYVTIRSERMLFIGIALLLAPFVIGIALILLVLLRSS